MCRGTVNAGFTFVVKEYFGIQTPVYLSVQNNAIAPQIFSLGEL
jgi:hypothetical protein